jgi:tetratricopeptide (TPR) repeat protein
MMPERRLLLAAVCAAALALAAACASSAKVQQAKQEKDPQYQYEKAVICMNAGLTDAAIPYLNQALALDPRHHPSLNLLGLARLIKGDLPAAIAALEKCVEVAPAFSDAHNNLATALQESGQTERAEAAYRKAFALDENYNASFNLAKIEFQRNSLEPATPLYLGPASEIFTGTLLSQMVNEQKISLDVPIAQFIPELASLKARRSGMASLDMPLTLRQLAAHRVAFPEKDLPLAITTSILLAPATRWLLVRTWPWASTMTPLPSPTISCLYFLGSFLGRLK